MTQRRRGRHRSPKRSAGYQLIDSGHSDSEIARRLGVSRTAVAHWRRERGVPPLNPADHKSAPATASTRRRRSAREPMPAETLAFVSRAVDSALAHAAQQPRRPSVPRRVELSHRENSVALGFYPGGPTLDAAGEDTLSVSGL